jgi:YHS domain-containing protein
MTQMENVPMAKDPVCGMQVSPEVAKAKGLTADHDGETYYFCGKGCQLDFMDDPRPYFEPGYQPHM